MEWKKIDPTDYNDTDTEPFYEINEMGQVRKIKNQKEIRLQIDDRYYLKNRRVNKSALLNKYYSKNIKVKAQINDKPALNLTGYEPLKNYSNYLIDRNGNVFSTQINPIY